MTPEYLTMKEVAESFRVSIKQVRMLIANGHLEAVDMSISSEPKRRQWRVSKKAVEEFGEKRARSNQHAATV